MAKFTYPANDLDRRRNLLPLLGSHWNNVYAGNSVIESYLFARAQEEAQAHLDLLETVASISRLSTPVFHRDNWYLLELKESEHNNQPLRYGDGAVYGSGTPYYTYGEQIQSPWHVFPLPTDFVSAKTIFNRILEPSCSLTLGVDYLIEDGLIKFHSNPFDNTLIAKRVVYLDGEQVDRTLGLWVYRGQWDWRHIDTHIGFIVGMVKESSEHYRDFLNALLDAFVQGTAAKQIDLALSAITGIPVVVEAEETVEIVQVDRNHLVISTDQNCYLFHPDSTATVEVGDVVHAGDKLTTGFEVIELNRGEIPDDVYSIQMGHGMIAGGYLDGVSFVNQEVPLIVTSDDDGITRVEFEVGGFPTDVEAFWDEVHRRGKLPGATTLARLMDVRGSSAPTEPGAASLPTTVNPLHFLVENLLRFNTFVVRIRFPEAAGGVGLDASRLLRKIIPPWTAAIILCDLNVTADEIDPTEPGDETHAGADETQEYFAAGTPIVDTISPASVEEQVVAYLVEGACE